MPCFTIQKFNYLMTWTNVIDYLLDMLLDHCLTIDSLKCISDSLCNWKLI